MRTVVLGNSEEPEVIVAAWREQARRWDGEGNCRIHVQVDNDPRTLRITARWSVMWERLE